MRNLDSARISVPGIIKENTGTGSAMSPPSLPPSSDSPEVGPSPFPPPDPVAPSPAEFPLIWRTDLRAMGPYWEGESSLCTRAQGRLMDRRQAGSAACRAGSSERGRPSCSSWPARTVSTRR